MKEATVVLQHKKKKDRKISVSMSEYATDLGKEKFKAYELAGDRHNGTAENKVEVKPITEPTEPTEDKFKELENLNSESDNSKNYSKKKTKKS